MSSTKQTNYFLIDCNQFFVSCEQVFSPKLRQQPVVVLSNNDGCVIARSPQAKKLGIPMGAPAYQYRDLFRTHKVHVLSPNFALYGDMSQRVMQVLSQFSQEMEEYSIDEAFLRVSIEDPTALAQEIRARVLQWTGIPVSIGIGPTKTLAKVANDLAKKTEGVFAFSSASQSDAVLERLPVKEIWGIGSRLSAALESGGIDNARQFKDASDDWIKKRFSVVLLRTAYELRGVPCLTFNELPVPRQSMTYSRSFARPVKALNDLEEALSCYTAHAAEKLREEELLPSVLTIFLVTASPSWSRSWTLTLDEPTTFTPTLTAKAKEALRQIFRPGYAYKKTGILLGGFAPKESYQPDLFSANPKERAPRTRAIKALDEINQRYGRPALRFAAEGLEQRWKSKRANVSPRFTTCWDELLKVKAST